MPLCVPFPLSPFPPFLFPPSNSLLGFSTTQEALLSFFTLAMKALASLYFSPRMGVWLKHECEDEV